ncbi:lipoate--protein ligase family protein [Natronorubrum texcoconense]|uniref:Lipoate-protein ligase A n=1 Tax=Natronorubrum texcoconense TaxID=1095776 RepID=A0A1G8TW99_9EURY|nr:biotin/lipoate A/B protein ligase family protein [Natronorubrum texcoconense]SDJ45846.1 lipoate-protein ligase A [Natronorubrum texcoconense]
MSDLADREWRLIRDDPRAGDVQMAVEEVAARTALEDDLRTVRVYSWEPSTLSLGYRQDPETVDWDYCEREGIDVTRRQTGGGGIYHDRYADISYTIIAPADEVPGNLMDCYDLFCQPVLEGLQRMGVDADFAGAEQSSIYQPSCYLRDINPAHDVVAPATGGAEAKKISGNAQYRQRDVVIQHGSISYDLEPAHHVGVFDTDLEHETFTDRVTSIRKEAGIDREEAVDTLASALGEWCDADESEWQAGELEAARDLADRKFGADAWIRNREVLEATER